MLHRDGGAQRLQQLLDLHQITLEHVEVFSGKSVPKNVYVYALVSELPPSGDALGFHLEHRESPTIEHWSLNLSSKNWKFVLATPASEVAQVDAESCVKTMPGSKSFLGATLIVKSSHEGRPHDSLWSLVSKHPYNLQLYVQGQGPPWWQPGVMRVYGAYSQNPTRLPDSVRSCEVEDGPRHSRFREQEACTNRPLISTDIFWRADGVDLAAFRFTEQSTLSHPTSINFWQQCQAFWASITGIGEVHTPTEDDCTVEPETVCVKIGMKTAFTAGFMCEVGDAGTVIIEPFQVKDARTGKTPYHSYTSKGDSSAVNYIIKNGKLCPMSIHQSANDLNLKEPPRPADSKNRDAIEAWQKARWEWREKLGVARAKSSAISSGIVLLDEFLRDNPHELHSEPVAEGRKAHQDIHVSFSPQHTCRWSTTEAGANASIYGSR